MRFTAIFSLAFRQIRSKKLRTGLTVAIIACGIMALVGIITAIKAMNQKFTESFSTMGANGFTIRFKKRQILFGGGGESDLKVAKKGKRKEKKKKPRVWENRSPLSKPMSSDSIIPFPLPPAFLFLSTGIQLFRIT